MGLYYMGGKKVGLEVGVGMRMMMMIEFVYLFLFSYLFFLGLIWFVQC
jgi:hypothetical protein